MSATAFRSSILGPCVLVVALLLGCTQTPPVPSTGGEPLADASEPAFRNAATTPPPGWQGPVFTLSHDYPTQDPGECPKELCTWLAVDVDFTPNFSSQPPDWNSGPWATYIQRILDYVKQGQDPNLANDVGVRTQVDGKTRWFHVPWMAYDPTAGREFVHGTTNERTAHLSDLLGQDKIGDGDGNFGVHVLPAMTPDCTKRFPHGFESWSVGVYNEWGGWALGRSWPKTGRPALAQYQGSTMPAGLPFPEGTVVAKFLTSSVPADCVPYLKGAPEWQVDRHKMSPTSGLYSCEREVQTDRLVQVDVAVVDSRSPTRWVYGTFSYNGNLPGATVWDRLAPVGLQWGSDPWTFPAVPKAESLPARQSVINRNIGIYQHLGCNARLAGPVDSPMSSCVSCHASGYAAPGGVPSNMGVNVPASFGFDGICTQFSQENVAYFQNQTPPQTYPNGRFPQAMSLDTSLQMAVAFNQYGFFNTTGKPQACVNPNQF